MSASTSAGLLRKQWRRKTDKKEQEVLEVDAVYFSVSTGHEGVGREKMSTLVDTAKLHAVGFV